jgi:UDP-N-acetylmuramate dehydrogenase
VKIEQDVLLSRFTTLGTGGEARAFARPQTLEELQEALAYAGSHDLPVAVVGLGSNLLVADEGFDGLALKLVGGRGRAGRRRGWGAERGRPPSRSRRGPRWLRVRLRDSRDCGRRGLDERRRLRQRLGGDS